jgi:hypothetical protein
MNHNRAHARDIVTDDLPPNWQEIDALESYHAAIAAIGERVRNGMPVPQFMRSRKEAP